MNKVKSSVKPMTLKEYLKPGSQWVKDIRYSLVLIHEGVQTFVIAKGSFMYSLEGPGHPPTVRYGDLQVRQDLPVNRIGSDWTEFRLCPHTMLMVVHQ